MKLVLENVGKIKKRSEIEINGITVLAGQNGTGKSTIGKALFCVFDTFRDYKNQVRWEREKSVRRLLQMYSYADPRIRRTPVNRDYIGELVERASQEDAESLAKELIVKSIPVQYAEDNKKELKELRERLVRALDADEQQVLEGMLNRRLQSEYNNQVRHVNNDRQDANIELHLKDGVIHINVSSDNTTRIVSKVNLVKNIIYIDDPNILDDLDDYGIMRTRQRHKTKLVEKLDYKYKPDLSAVDGIIIDERIKRIEERLKDINLGELDFSTDYGYQYRDASLKEGISLENLSMGLKSYVILKTLLEKSVIEDNGILILDEPEIHLHPEWMRLYAEIVVLLQKEFGLNIVISTHSSDFLGFIELFATKNGIVDKCKYYMLNNSKEGSEYSEIEDVSENVDKIYDMLGKPFIEASEELGRLNETV